MLKLMETDFIFHWDMVQDSKARGWEEPRAYHEGACDLILKYYVVLLDCAIVETSRRMQDRFAGEVS